MEKLVFLENKQYTEFSPTMLGWEKCHMGHSFGPHVRNEYVIHFVVGGYGTFINQNDTYSISSGSAFVIRPGENCTYYADMDTPWEYIWIHFDGRLAKHFDDVDDVFEYDKSFVSDIMSAFNMESGVEEYLTGMLFVLHSTLFGSLSKNDYPKKVKGYIDSNYMRELRIEDIASSLNLSRKYLSRIFKEKYNISMQQYIVKKRMIEAKKLLEAGYRVEETAYMVGYSDSFNFSKAFKQYFGKPPVCFRGKQNYFEY